jgi:hypothetical protein
MAKKRLVKNSQGQYGILDENTNQVFVIDQNTKLKSSGGKYFAEKDGNRYNVDEVDDEINDDDINLLKKKDVSVSSGPTDSTDSGLSKIGETPKDATAENANAARRFLANPLLPGGGLDYSGLSKFGVVGEFVADALDVPTNLINAGVRTLFSSTANQGMVELSHTNVANRDKALDKYQDIADNYMAASMIPKSSYYQKMEKGEADWFDKAAAIPEILTESLLGVTGAWKTALATGVAAAPAAAAVGTIYAPVTATAGFLGGIQAGSTYVAEVGGTIQQKLEERGIDTTDAKQLQAAFQDEKLIEEVRADGIKRGIPVAAIDLITGGLSEAAGKAAVKVASKAANRAGAKLEEEFISFGVNRVIDGAEQVVEQIPVAARTGLTDMGASRVASAATMATETVGGMLGEAVGQLVSEGKISDWDSVLMEGIAEVGSGAPTGIYSYVKANQINRQFNKKADETITALEDALSSMSDIDPGRPVLEERIKALKGEKEQRNNMTATQLEAAPVTAAKRILELTDQIDGLTASLDQMKSAPDPNLSEEQQREKRRVFMEQLDDLIAERDELLSEAEKARASFAETTGAPTKPLEVKGGDAFDIFDIDNEIEPNEAFTVDPAQPVTVTASETKNVSLEERADGKPSGKRTMASVFNIEQGGKKLATALEVTGEDGSTRYYVPELQTRFNTMDEASAAVKEKLSGNIMSEQERSGINRILVRKGLLKTPIVFTRDGQQMQISNEAKLRIIKAQKALRSVSDANIYLYTTDDDYVAGLRSESNQDTFDEQAARASNASYVRDGNIHINVNKMNQASISHEIFHAALVSIASKNPQAFIDMRKKIMGRIKKDTMLNVRDKSTGELIQMSGADYLNAFAESYGDDKGNTEDVRAEEYLSELAGLISNNENLLTDKTFIESVRLAFRSLLQKLNIDTTAFDELADATELVDFMKSFNESVKTGSRIKLDKIKGKYETRAKKSPTQQGGEDVTATTGEEGVQTTEEVGPSTEGVQTAVKRKRGNKTPAGQRKIKDPVMKRALEVESSSLSDIVKQYFIKGGTIIRGRTKDISKRTVTPEAGSLVTLFTTKGPFGYKDDTKAMRARFKLTDSRENGALTIPEIAKAIVDSEVGKKYKLVTGEVESALESMLLEFSDRKAMAQSVLDDNGISLEAEAQAAAEAETEAGAEAGFTAEEEAQTQSEFEEFVAEETGMSVDDFQEAVGEDPDATAAQEAADEAVDIVDNPEENPEIAGELEVTPEEDEAIDGMSDDDAKEYLGGNELEPKPVKEGRKRKQSATAAVGESASKRKPKRVAKGEPIPYETEVDYSYVTSKISAGEITLGQLLPKIDFYELLKSGEITLKEAAMIKLSLSMAPSSIKTSSNITNILYTRRRVASILSGEFDPTNYRDYNDKSFETYLKIIEKIKDGLSINTLGKASVWVSKNSDGEFSGYITKSSNGSVNWDLGKFTSEEDLINKFIELYASEKVPTRKSNVAIVKERIGRATYWRVGREVRGKFFPVPAVTMFSSKIDAEKYVNDNIERIKEYFDSDSFKETLEDFLKKFDSNRIGTDWRQGKDITSQQLFETFEFKGVDFNKSMDKDEKQSLINDTYDALMDMSELLGVPPKSLGLGGKIILSFGAQDRKNSAAAAHYNPVDNAINISRLSGVGSFAHEWWHALDHHFGVMGFGKYDLVTRELDNNFLATPQSSLLRDEMFDAYKKLASYFSSSDLKSRSKITDVNRRKVTRGKYYSTMVEMTARAFENYVQYKMSENNKRNDFLVATKSSMGYDSLSSEDSWAKSFVYVKPDEIAEVSELYDNFFKTIEAKEENNRTILYQASGLEVEPRAIGLTSDIIAASNEAKDNVSEDGQVTVRYQQKYGNIELYHGSGWVFDKFSLDHLGKGEGAQMYGYGMYLSEDKNIAAAYAKSNQGNKLKIMGLLNFLPKKLQNEAYGKLQGNISIKDWEKYLDTNKGFLGLNITKSQRKKLLDAYGYRNVYTVMYRPAKGTSLWLDWHTNVSPSVASQIISGAKSLIKPLHAQFKTLIDKNGKALKGKEAELMTLNNAFQIVKILGEETTINNLMAHTGGELYGKIQSTFKNQKDASQLLLMMGIDGNRVPVGYFLNNMSGQRTVAPDQKYNYIVFDADRLKIMNRSTMRFQSSEGANLALVDDAAEYKMVELYGNPQEMLAHFESKFKVDNAAQQKGFATKLSKASRTIEGAITDNIMTRAAARLFNLPFDAIDWIGDAGFINITKVDENGNTTKEKVSFNSLWKSAFGMSEGKARELTLKGLESNNKFANIASNVATGLIKNLSVTDKLQKQSREYTGYKDNAHNLIRRLSTSLNGMVGFDAQALRRVHSLLDPEAFEGMDRTDLPGNPLELSVSELRLFNALRTMNDYMHEWHYKNGFLDKETYDKFKGKYFGRMYSEIEHKQFKDVSEAMDSMTAGTDLSMFKQRKDFEMVDLNLMEDPIYITCKRLAQMAHNQAVVDFCDSIAESNEYAIYDKLDDIPENLQKYYKKLEGFGNNKRFGELTNKYVPLAIHEEIYGTQFASQFMSDMFNLFKKYDKLALRQMLKKSKTVYNPLARLGNIVSSFAFAFQGGVNPFSLLQKRIAAKEQIDNYGEYVQDLTKAGVIGTSGVNQMLLGMDENSWSYRTLVALKVPQKVLANANDFDNMVKETYGKADDVAKVAMYMSLVQDRGKTKEEAIQIVAESMQNYKTVGKYFVLSSMTPVFGNAFIRFKADATRILYNGIAKRPLYTAAYIGMLYGVKELLSDLSGEDDEEKEAREERPFTTKWGAGPFAIPMNWKVGSKEFNVGRYLSPYYIYDQGYYGDNLVDASQYLPYQVQKLQPGKGRGLLNTGYVPGLTDPFLGVGAQLLFDYDYKGNSVADPGASRFMPQTVSSKQMILNQLAFAGRSLGSPYYGWIADQNAAWEGKLDVHDRKRDPLDAALSLVIKNEEIDSKILTEKYANHLNRMFKQHQAALDLIKVTRTRMQEDILRIQSNTELTPAQKQIQIQDVYEMAEELRVEKHNEMLRIAKEAEEPYKRFLKLKQPKK